MVEPLSVGVHAVRRGQVSPGKTVAIMGAGPIGARTPSPVTRRPGRPACSMHALLAALLRLRAAPPACAAYSPWRCGADQVHAVCASSACGLCSVGGCVSSRRMHAQAWSRSWR